MAEGTKLADAYVQIIPISEGITGRIKDLFKDLPDEGDSAGEKTGESFATKLKKAVVAAVVVCGMVVTVSEVVTAFAGSGVLVSTALFFLLTTANTDDAAMIATATQTIGMALLRDVFTFISISLRSLTMDIQAKQKVESS